MEVEAAPIEAMRGEAGFGLAARSGGAIYSGIGLVFTMPDRGDAESYWPIGGTLIDGGIAIVAKLIAVVLEGLAEGTEHGPGEMARRAGHAVFPRKGGNSVNLDGGKGSRRSRIAGSK